jgi:hypothetical protein
MVTGPEDAMAAPAGGHGRMRASDADREQAIDVLKVAFVEGRLVKDELDARAGRAFTSRTYAELAAVTADIPADPVPAGIPADPAGVPPLRERAQPPGRPPEAQVFASCAITIIAAELFLLLTVFAFPFYGTLDLALLANLVGLPLAGGMMVDTWRANRAREQRARRQASRDQASRGQASAGPTPRGQAPRGQTAAGHRSAATCSKVSMTARPTVIRVSPRSARMSVPCSACAAAAYAERRTAARLRRP